MRLPEETSTTDNSLRLGGDLTDEALIRGFLDGSQDCFEELVRKHENQVFNLAYRVLGNRTDAADACQETFVLLLRKLHTFRGESSFSTWLYRVSLNVCRDNLRKQKKHPLPAAPPEEGPRPEELLEAGDAFDPHALFEQVETKDRVQSAIAKLPPKFKEVVYLHDIRGFNYAEVADILSVAIGTVKSRLNRARIRLAQELEEREP